jgi:transcription initiation factor TFIID TATA-box-binding protein
MKDPKATFLLFGSGKIICTGTRKIEEVNLTVNSLFKKLRSIDAFKKK